MARKVSFTESMVGNYTTAHVMQLIRSAKQRSNLKNVAFVGLDELFTHVQKELDKNDGLCECCGKEFQRKEDGKGGGGKDSLSLHRVIASKGYVADNVKIICQACNNAIGEVNTYADIVRKESALRWQAKLL